MVHISSFSCLRNQLLQFFFSEIFASRSLSQQPVLSGQSDGIGETLSRHFVEKCRMETHEMNFRGNLETHETNFCLHLSNYWREFERSTPLSSTEKLTTARTHRDTNCETKCAGRFSFRCCANHGIMR